MLQRPCTNSQLSSEHSDSFTFMLTPDNDLCQCLLHISGGTEENHSGTSIVVTVKCPTDANSDFISNEFSEEHEEHVTASSQIPNKYEGIANGNYWLGLQPISADFEKKRNQQFLCSRLQWYIADKRGRAVYYIKCLRPLERSDRLRLFCVCVVLCR
jgi:hypothetical protein